MDLQAIKRFIPTPLFNALAPTYHKTLAWLGPQLYGDPSRHMKVIAVTGTKGKSSVTEFMNAILEHAGYKTALASTIRFKLDNWSSPNKYKMTMPGRFFLQRFLNKALKAECDWAVVEMTSEGVKQYRHRGVELNALIFTNIAPEHIESHGSFANYVAAKFEIGKTLERSKKRPRIMVANVDDEYGPDFLTLNIDVAAPYALENAQPYTVTDKGTEITFDGEKIFSPLRGEFTAYNMLAAATCAKALGIEAASIRAGLEACIHIPGRVELIEEGQNFEVVVDYAHTLESLEKVYQAFDTKKKICILGNTGGGRDTWKRPKMAQLAEKYCEHVILTDEDPYDENPETIVQEMADGMQTQPEIIMDRRLAIRRALSLAKQGKGDAVLVTGKGTDPYIMRAQGAREPWSDAGVTREELKLLLQ